jgi:hypothetical protein
MAQKQYHFNTPRFEYWYDPNPEHCGAIRIIDYKDHKIYGSDPDLPYWVVTFEFIDIDDIKIDFHLKKTHKIQKILYATFLNQRQNLNFRINQKDDPVKNKINSWQKIGQNPEILINLLVNNLKSITKKKVKSKKNVKT